MSGDPHSMELLQDPRTAFFGKHRGVVRQNVDPETRGRLLVVVPKVLGDREVWALPCVPYAGDQKGFYSMPDNGTVVWVEFEGGDANYPIWTGCLWKKGELPKADAVGTVKFWKTDKFTLRIDEATGEVTLSNQSGAEIVMGPLGITIEGAQVTVKTSGGREVALGADGVNVNKGALKVL